MIFSPWKEITNEFGEKQMARNISYNLNLKYSFVSKKCFTNEKQVCKKLIHRVLKLILSINLKMMKECEEGKSYVVETICDNDELPYGDRFCVLNKYFTNII